MLRKSNPYFTDDILLTPISISAFILRIAIVTSIGIDDGRRNRHQAACSRLTQTRAIAEAVCRVLWLALKAGSQTVGLLEVLMMVRISDEMNFFPIPWGQNEGASQFETYLAEWLRRRLLQEYPGKNSEAL